MTASVSPEALAALRELATKAQWQRAIRVDPACRACNRIAQQRYEARKRAA